MYLFIESNFENAQRNPHCLFLAVSTAMDGGWYMIIFKYLLKKLLIVNHYNS